MLSLLFLHISNTKLIMIYLIWVMSMKKFKFKIDVYELKVIIKSLNELRNKLINNKENIDIVDELLIKYIDMLN